MLSKIRLAFAVLSGLSHCSTTRWSRRSSCSLLVVALDLVIVWVDSLPVSRRGSWNTMILTLLCVSAAAAGARPCWTGAVLLILIPAYHAGSKDGRFGFLLTCVVAGGAFLMSTWLYPPEDQTDNRFGLIVWIGAAITLGVLGAWNKKLTDEQEQDVDPAAREAIELISASRTCPARCRPASMPRPARRWRSTCSRPRCRRPAAPCSSPRRCRAPRAGGTARFHQYRCTSPSTSPTCSARASWVPTEVTFNDDLGRRRALVVTALRAWQRVDDRGRGGAAGRQAVQRRRTEHRARRDPADRSTLQAGLLFGTLRQFASLEERTLFPRRHRPGARRPRLPGRRPAGAGRAICPMR